MNDRPLRARFFQHGETELWSARVDALTDDDPIVARCAELEARAWTPREPFLVGHRRSDHLLWAARGDSVAGFLLLSVVSSEEEELVVSIDEAMVDPALVGTHVVSSLFWSAACGVTARTEGGRHAAKRIVFFALTSNPRLIRAFYKYRFLLPEHSFAPSARVESRAAEYLVRRDLEPLSLTSSVWAKGAFPGGLRRDEPELGNAVPIPPGFDPRLRGDALLMVGAIPTAIARPIALARHALLFRNVLGRRIVLPW